MSDTSTNTPEEDFEMQQVAKNNGDNLMFGDADKCKEWPAVGDEAVLVSMGLTPYNKPVRLTYIGNGVGCYVDMTNGMEYTYAKRETVFKKPKTPEEELRELLSLLWKENNHDFDMFLDVVTCHVTKKPQ